MKLWKQIASYILKITKNKDKYIGRSQKDRIFNVQFFTWGFARTEFP